MEKCGFRLGEHVFCGLPPGHYPEAHAGRLRHNVFLMEQRMYTVQIEVIDQVTGEILCEESVNDIKAEHINTDNPNRGIALVEWNGHNNKFHIRSLQRAAGASPDLPTQERLW